MYSGERDMGFRRTVLHNIPSYFMFRLGSEFWRNFARLGMVWARLRGCIDVTSSVTEFNLEVPYVA